jgi:protein PhnA
MSDTPRCPKCNYEYTYHNGTVQVCTDCLHEWDPNETVAETAATSDKVLDANGNELVDGDTVVVMKDLPVKGALRPVKAGTKVKNIKLVEGDHNISCKIDGFGSMGLKSEFVKKA